MFKVNSINGDSIETTYSASNVLGSALHKALQAYLGGDPDYPTPADEGEAIKHGHDIGLKYLHEYSDGLIKYNKTTIPSRAVLEEKYAFCYFGYIKEFGLEKRVKEILLVEKKIKHKVEIDGKELPIPLVSIPDLVYRDHKDRLCIDDHKFTGTYSKDDEIDGPKLLQAAFLYFTVYAELGEAPYQVSFREFKTTKNQDKSPQTNPFTLVYKDSPMVFDLFFRMYADVTDALLGKQVFVPNFSTMFDREVSVLAYIHRLDIDEERARKFEEMKVDNITDFLKQKIQKDGSMKKYLETVSAKFISATTLNYNEMNTQERIKMKLAEHGLGVEFHDKIVGSSVTLYRFEPSIGLKMSKIEAYAKDIEQVVEVSNIRIIAPMPDSGFIGFEVPNEVRTFPVLPAGSGFDIAVGETIMGKIRRFDIREAPHILVAGTTGSGKSVWLNNLIKQLLHIKKTDLHLFDPKEVELVHFEGVKGVKEYKSNKAEIAVSLSAIVKEMENRYTLMKNLKIRNISQTGEFNYKFIVIDEYADLTMSTFGPDIENFVQLLAQKGRACGIHLIIATQRASTRVINGDIKINFNTRVVFKMAKEVDSRVMLDMAGAEKLLGKGDLLFVGDHGVERLQGYND